MTRRGKNGHIVADHIRRGLLFWAIILTFMLIFGSFLWLGFSQGGNNTSGTYVPPRSVNGEIIPGHVVRE